MGLFKINKPKQSNLILNICKINYFHQNNKSKL